MWPRFSARWCRLGNTAVSLSRYATTPGVAAPLTVAHKTHSAGLMIAAVYLDGCEWKRKAPRLLHAELTESRGKRADATDSSVSEAVGRATRGMDRETRGLHVPLYFYGRCETARLSIHVPAEGCRRPATHRRTRDSRAPWALR